MAETMLTKKLSLRPGNRALLLNAPDGYRARLEPLSEGVRVDATSDGAGTYDFVQIFARNAAEFNDLAQTALEAVRPGGVLWGCYPKGASGAQTDLTRDKGWDIWEKAGWEIVAAISLDDFWSGSRFRPSGDVKRKA